MSGDRGNLGVEPRGGVALQQRPYSHGEHRPRVEREQKGRQQTDLGAAGSSRRPIHRMGSLAVFAAMSAVQVAWVVALVWGALWIWGQLPLV